MILLLLFSTGLLAGMVDAIAGGGGLISVPVLFSLGIPPHILLGTNKLQGVIGTAVATVKYYRHGLIAPRTIFLGLIFGALGACVGAITSQILSGDFLRGLVPVLLFAILLYTIFSPRFDNVNREPRVKAWAFYMVFGFVMSFYDGFFGPGTGSFWVFGLTFFLGYNLIKATAYTKAFNLNSSLIATLCFALGGNIDYRIAGCMAAGQVIGGKLGAHLAITKGARLIRPIFLWVVSLTITSMIYKVYAHSFVSHFTAVHHYIPQVLILLMVVSGILFYVSRNKRRQTPMDI